MPEQRAPEGIRAAVSSALARASLALGAPVLARDEGRVEGLADDVLHVSGLPGATLGEVLRVGADARALVVGLRPERVDAVALDRAEGLRQGSRVEATGQTAAIPAGDPLLGRVVDPLGRPLDGAPLRGLLHPAPLERRAPRIDERAAVHTPLLSGVLAIDAMFPIGRGQRELILGEEGTGKTALALDVMLRQARTDVLCVYAAIGRRRAETWRVVEALRRGGGRWAAVSAPDDACPGLRYLCPYAATAIAEHFARRGEHVLVVYDDLTAHAAAWRELSLLLRRPPGREAYPGDVFYLHSRLLERAAQLSPALGGGSITALPLAVLEVGRLAAFIPTNLISITDGQLVLSQALFAAGQRPAIDAGLSVSRVGARAQPQAFRELARGMRLDYSGFLELEAFSRLGTRLEAATQRRIDVGRRIRGLLRAHRLEPLSVLEEVARLVLAGAHDLLLTLPEGAVERTAADLAERARRELPLLAARVERDAVLAEDDRQALLELLARLVAARGEPPRAG
jgi:F-type H+-transporting ATPase subunit alpha